MRGVPAEYFAAAVVYGAWVATIVRAAVDALGDWRAGRRQWGQRNSALEVSPRLAITWEPNRLRYRRKDMGYSYADLDDTPYVAPTPKMLTAPAATAKRNAVISEVSRENAGWMKEALDACRSLPSGELGIGEDIKVWLLAHGLRAPRHPNVWGALFNTLTRRGVLVATGEYRAMKADGSNGRQSRVYARRAEAA